MDFDTALTHEGPLLAAWDYRPSNTGFLRLFHVPGDALEELSMTKVAAADREAFVDRLVARGVRLGSAGGRYVWSIDETGVTVWNESKVAEKTRPTNAIRVDLFVVPRDIGRRSVRFVLADGATEIVVEDLDIMPSVDPAYGDDDLFSDTVWARVLGRQLAAWLSVPFVNEYTGKMADAHLPVVLAARDVAERLRRDGAEIISAIGPIGRATSVAFRVPPSHTEIELTIVCAGRTIKVLQLKQGTTAQLIAFLGRVTTPETVIHLTYETIEGAR